MADNEAKLDDLTSFEQNVLHTIKKIPLGKITTYGLLAQAIKKPGSARAIGNALHKNPCAPQIPCHRIIKSDGSIGGYAKGIDSKIRLLKQEGIEVTFNKKIKELDKVLYEFK